MKYERANRFKRDWPRLSASEKEMFRSAALKFNDACEAFVSERQRFPASLRVRKISTHDVAWEMTWSFAGPDGRATFQWTTIEGETGILWRRIGGHEIFGEP